MTRGPSFKLRNGIVASFDDPAGYGTITDTSETITDGVSSPAEWFFHCSAIADGSRAIEPGTPVTCHLVSGHMGRIEATDIRPA